MARTHGAARGRVNPYDLEVFRAVQRLKAQRGDNASLTSLDICQEADVSRMTVSRALRRLQQAFFLEVENAGGSRGYLIDVIAVPDAAPETGGGHDHAGSHPAYR